MSTLEQAILENKEQLKNHFIEHIRAYAQEVGATNVFWYQTLDEERLSLEVMGPFLIVNQKVRLPRRLEIISMDSEDHQNFWRTLYTLSQSLKGFEVLEKYEGGVYKPDFINVDVSKFKDMIKHSTSLRYAFGECCFVWVSENGYFESEYDLFCIKEDL